MLVVDDERAIRRSMEVTLGAQGYEVLTAVDGETALTVAARGRPDVVVLDLGLPGISGQEVIGAPRAGRRCRSSCCRPATPTPRRSPPSTAGPTTTSPSPSAWRSSRPASAPRCAGGPSRAAAAEQPVVRHRRLRRRPGAHAGGARRRGGAPHAHRVAPARRCWCATPGGSSPASDCSPRCGGRRSRRRPTTCGCSWPNSRAKLEPDPAAPRYLLTEPGLGARVRALRSGRASSSHPAGATTPERRRPAWSRKLSAHQERRDPVLGPADDGTAALHQHRALQQLGVLGQHVGHLLGGLHVGVGRVRRP